MIHSLINACLNFCTAERHIDEVIDFTMNRGKILKKSVAWMLLSHGCAALNPEFSARHSQHGYILDLSTLYNDLQRLSDETSPLK
jgi:hypothetical protein